MKNNAGIVFSLVLVAAGTIILIVNIEAIIAFAIGLLVLSIITAIWA